MASKSFIKDNFVLVAGLALPVLMVAIFMLATVLPKSMSAPPAHDFLFHVDQYGSTPVSFMTDLIVRDGKLHARLKKADQNYYNTKKIYRYQAKNQSVSEISFSLPADASDGTEIIVDATSAFTLDSNMTAPDGYIFRPAHSGHGGLINEVFVGGGYRSSYYLSKGNVSWKLPEVANQPYYYGLNFIGWVVGGNGP